MEENQSFPLTMSLSRKRGQMVQRIIDPQWFPRSSDEFESRIDLIERNEDAYAAKQRSLAQVQALAPIGVTPAIMAKIEKQIHDGPDEGRKPAKEYFWNRKIVNDTMEEDSVQSTYRMETPKSRTSEGASFSLDTPGSQDSTEMVMLDDP